jgi:hypothetical protein
MPGTFMSDLLETNLLTGMDLATDATSAGTIVQVDWPRNVRFVLTTGTVTGVNSVVIEGSESSTFAGTAGVTYGGFNLVAGDDDAVYEFNTDVRNKYIRVKLTIGTGGDLSASTLYMRPPHWQELKSDSTTDLVAA